MIPLLNEYNVTTTTVDIKGVGFDQSSYTNNELMVENEHFVHQ